MPISRLLIFSLPIVALVGCVAPYPTRQQAHEAQARLSRIPLIPVEDSKGGEFEPGLKADNPAWDAHRDYLKKLIEAVQKRWDQTISSSRYYPKQKSTVVVTFALNAEGRVEKFIAVGGTSDSLAGNWCVMAISPTETFSYGSWSEQMKADLGPSQVLSFNFLYR